MNDKKPIAKDNVKFIYIEPLADSADGLAKYKIRLNGFDIYEQLAREVLKDSGYKNPSDRLVASYKKQIIKRADLGEFNFTNDPHWYRKKNGLGPEQMTLNFEQFYRRNRLT